MRQLIKIAITALLISCSFLSCQSEKFTEKGIPEVRTKGVEILQDGVTFHGEIISEGGKMITEHGFAWTTDGSFGTGDVEYVLLGPVEGKTQFSVTVNSAIEKDEVYTMRAFIKADEMTSYGNEVTFAGNGSKPPELISVTPASALVGDTVVIKGRYFTYNPASCSVLFDDIEVLAESSTAEELRVVVPCSMNGTMTIRVSIAGIFSSNVIQFNLKTPTLLGFSPSSGTFGDIVTLSGTGMPADTSCFEVFFDEAKAVVTEAAGTYCRVRVPTANNTSPATIKLRCFTELNFADNFILKQAVITNVYPPRVFLSQTVMISGENFNPDPKMNHVEVGGFEAIVISSTAREIRIKLPSRLESGYYPVTVTTIAGSPVTWDGGIEVERATWTRMADFPPSGRVAAAGFTARGKIYFGTGLAPDLDARSDFWEYDPEINTWTRRADFPMLITYATGFSINDMGYFAMGKLSSSYYRTLNRYDPVNNSWKPMSPNPGESSSMDSPGFVINGKAYIPAAGEMYEYDPAYDRWTQKSYPYALGYFGGGSAFSINGKGYLGVGWDHDKHANVRDFFEYDPVTDIWTQKASFPGTLRDNATSFSLPNGKGYVAMGYSTAKSVYLNDVWEYDPVSDSWTKIEDFPGTPRFGARAFVYGSEAYIIGGYGGIYEKDMWRFLPLGE